MYPARWQGQKSRVNISILKIKWKKMYFLLFYSEIWFLNCYPVL